MSGKTEPKKDAEPLPLLIATAGLPGSGKTTWAKRMVASGGYVRVNNDEIRENHPRAHEATIRNIRDSQITRALSANINVIVDNTNLHGFSDLRKLAREHRAQFEVQDFRDVPWQECVRRDAERAGLGERATGRSVIIRMAMDAKLFKPEDATNKEAIIVDLDGTLSDTRHRLHHLQGEKPNWQEFFAGIPHDPVNSAVEVVYRMAVASGYTVILLSGRPENYRASTEEWLNRHGFTEYFALFMRPAQDRAPDTETKERIYNRYIKPYFKVVFTLDDRSRVVAMWRRLGLVCFQVAEGDE